MKKLLAILIALATVLSLCSCSANKGNEDESTNAGENDVTSNVVTETQADNETTKESVVHAENYITNEDTFVEKLSSLIDVSLYNYTEYDNSLGGQYMMDYDLQKKTSYNIDYGVKLDDGTEFTLPVPIKDLEKLGWTLTNNPKVEPGKIVSGPSLKNSDGDYLYFVSAANFTENTLDFSECILTAYKIELYTTDHKSEHPNAIGFTMCDTITEASTLEDIIQELGNPTSVSAYIYEHDGEYQKTTITLSYDQFGEVYNGLKFELSGDGNYIVKVEYSKSEVTTMNF